MLKRVLKFIGLFFGAIIALVIFMMLYIRAVSVTDPPVPASLAALELQVAQPDSGLFKIGNNWFRKSESGLYELYVEGAPFERGVINGKLTQDLVRYQEDAFNKQINAILPSEAYRTVIKYFVGFFNRNLADYVPEEYKLEIYGVSQAASSEYNDIASPYHRMLNYHAAHDIGHALQNMSLVGCTSFATWGSQSEDGSLIIGRNFDFYVGEEFARDKIVAFYNPDKGYKFMMVTFGGMTGVLSGMNAEGLTVTINAAKSEVPNGAADPVSLVAREILQYAATIDEAYAIAGKRKMFVAESFLIGSAREGRAAVIEKTPTAIELVNTDNDRVICANHFQGDSISKTALNLEHMRTSASVYRHDRVRDLLDGNVTNSVLKTAAILRDQKGKDGEDIGLGNEKVINQLVAHHAVIFQPEKRLAWISTSPWQLGKFICYDLNKVFADPMNANHELREDDKTIPPDAFLESAEYKNYVKFSKYRFPFQPRTDLEPDSVVKWNPLSYHAYMLAGDKLKEEGQYEKAADFYKHGLRLQIATLQEREHMERNLEVCQKKIE
jgi:isopenicillin-N N-acyltransferase like protein